MSNRILPPPLGHGPDEHDDGPEAAAFDRLIAEAARDYHRPPAEVPRDAMWEAIVASRSTRAGAAPAAPAVPVAAAPAVISLDAARAARRVPSTAPSTAARTWSLAAAASLLLAAGVGLGRWWESRSPAAAPVAAAPAAPAVVATAPDAPPATPAPDTMIADAAPEPPTALADRPAAREVATARAPRAPRAAGRARDDAGGLAYDVAAVRHLTAVEALLVSYRADPLDSLADARVASWARSLLQDTRLLLDSPAANAPVRRRLLEDLELVLVQMARLAPADSASGPAQLRREREERALIDGTMRDARVLPRLRRAIPAGVGA
jgi:hypothetical protein